MSGETINKQSSKLMVDGGLCFQRVSWMSRNSIQNGRGLYCSYQLDSNFQLFIFS